MPHILIPKFHPLRSLISICPGFLQGVTFGRNPQHSSAVGHNIAVLIELASAGLIIRHALGNALIPVLTVIGLGLGNLLGGMVLVETIFNWPGVGQFAYESVLSVDFPSIIGVALLIALNYMVINTVVDILYGIIDPRVRCS